MGAGPDKHPRAHLWGRAAAGRACMQRLNVDMICFFQKPIRLGVEGGVYARSSQSEEHGGVLLVIPSACVCCPISCSYRSQGREGHANNGEMKNLRQ